MVETGRGPRDRELASAEQRATAEPVAESYSKPLFVVAASTFAPTSAALAGVFAMRFQCPPVRVPLTVAPVDGL